MTKKLTQIRLGNVPYWPKLQPGSRAFHLRTTQSVFWPVNYRLKSHSRLLARQSQSPERYWQILCRPIARAGNHDIRRNDTEFLCQKINFGIVPPRVKSVLVSRIVHDCDSLRSNSQDPLYIGRRAFRHGNDLFSSRAYAVSHPDQRLLRP